MRAHAGSCFEVVLLILGGDRLGGLPAQRASGREQVRAVVRGRLGLGVADRTEGADDAVLRDPSVAGGVGEVRHAVRAHAGGVRQEPRCLRPAAGRGAAGGGGRRAGGHARRRGAAAGRSGEADSEEPNVARRRGATEVAVRLKAGRLWDGVLRGMWCITPPGLRRWGEWRPGCSGRIDGGRARRSRR